MVFYLLLSSTSFCWNGSQVNHFCFANKCPRPCMSKDLISQHIPAQDRKALNNFCLKTCQRHGTYADKCYCNTSALLLFENNFICTAWTTSVGWNSDSSAVRITIQSWLTDPFWWPASNNPFATQWAVQLRTSAALNSGTHPTSGVQEFKGGETIAS